MTPKQVRKALTGLVDKYKKTQKYEGWLFPYNFLFWAKDLLKMGSKCYPFQGIPEIEIGGNDLLYTKEGEVISCYMKETDKIKEIRKLLKF